MKSLRFALGERLWLPRPVESYLCGDTGFIKISFLESAPFRVFLSVLSAKLILYYVYNFPDYEGVIVSLFSLAPSIGRVSGSSKPIFKRFMVSTTSLICFYYSKYRLLFYDCYYCGWLWLSTDCLLIKGSDADSVILKFDEATEGVCWWWSCRLARLLFFRSIELVGLSRRCFGD